MPLPLDPESCGPAACGASGALAGVARAPRGRQPVDAMLREQERGQRGTARVHGERAGGERPTAQELQLSGGADVNALGRRGSPQAFTLTAVDPGVGDEGLHLALEERLDILAQRHVLVSRSSGCTSRVSRCRRARLRRAIGLAFDADAAPPTGPCQRGFNRPTRCRRGLGRAALTPWRTR